MNLKSNILKMGVVIALIFILIPVIAAEDVDNSVYTESVDQSTDVISEDVSVADDDLTATEDEGGDVAVADDEIDEDDDETDELTATEEDDETYDDAYTGGNQAADLQVTVINTNEQLHVGDIAQFGIFVYNNGPNKASNVLVSASFITGKVNPLAIIPSQGEFVIINDTLYWYVGDLDVGEYAMLGIIGQVLSDEDVILMATVTSDTFDPDLSNNIAFGFVDVASEGEVAKMPATGNPIALAILALLSVAGISLKRRF